MNCKPGDLAVVIAGEPRGTVVTCLRLLSEDATVTENGEKFPRLRPTEPAWALDRELDWGTPPLCAAAYDCNLMPIRPLPDEEVTDITERPVKVRR